MYTSVVRTLVLYLMVIAALRLMGKRQVGELEPSELVVAIMISELAAVPMQDFSIPILQGIAPMLCLLAFELLLSAGMLKSVHLRRILCGRPSVIVERGKIVQSELRRNRLTLDELIEELRLLGQTDFTKIQYAVLETNGKLSVVRYGEHQPAAAGELATLAGRDRPASPGLPVTLISDGNWQTKNIRRRGLTPEWVRQKLADLGFSSAKQVFLLTVDECDRLYCQEKQR